MMRCRQRQYSQHPTSYSAKPPVKALTMAFFFLALLMLIDTGRPTPAAALPIGDYLFDTDFIKGTFTSDGIKMTAWNFTTPDFGTGAGPILWSSADVTSVINNSGDGTVASLLQVKGFSSLSIVHYTGFSLLTEADIFVTVPCDVIEQCGGPTYTTGNIHIGWIPVPESTTILLLAVGLLGLMGVQRYQHPT